MKHTFTLTVETPPRVTKTAEELAVSIYGLLSGMDDYQVWAAVSEFQVEPVKPDPHAKVIVECVGNRAGLFVGIGRDPVYREQARQFTWQEAETFIDLHNGDGWAFRIIPLA